MKKCKHRFKPRYDETYTTVLEEMLDKKAKVLEYPATATVPYLKKKLYIYDICDKCGQIIKRI